MLQTRKTELNEIISNFDKNGCLETLLVHKISGYVCDNLLSKSYIDMKDIQTKVDTQAMKQIKAGHHFKYASYDPKNKIVKHLPGLF